MRFVMLRKRSATLLFSIGCAKPGVVVDAVSAGEIKRALKAGFLPNSHPKGIVYTADVFDREALDLVVEHDIHCNVGSPDMIGQLGQARTGPQHLVAHQSRLWTRSQSKDQHGRTAIKARDLA